MDTILMDATLFPTQGPFGPNFDASKKMILIMIFVLLIVLLMPFTCHCLSIPLAVKRAWSHLLLLAGKVI